MLADTIESGSYSVVQYFNKSPQDDIFVFTSPLSPLLLSCTPPVALQSDPVGVASRLPGNGVGHAQCE